VRVGLPPETSLRRMQIDTIGGGEGCQTREVTHARSAAEESSATPLRVHLQDKDKPLRVVMTKRQAKGRTGDGTRGVGALNRIDCSTLGGLETEAAVK